jgi:hypothetical protein
MAFFREGFLFAILKALRASVLVAILAAAGTGTASAQFTMDGGGDRPASRERGMRGGDGIRGDGMRSGVGIGIGIGIGRAIVDGAAEEDARRKAAAGRAVQDQKKKKASRKGDDTPVAVKPPKTPPTTTTDKPPPTTTDKPPVTTTDKPPPPTTTGKPPVTTTDKPPDVPQTTLPPTTAGPPPGTTPPTSPPDTTTTTTDKTRVPVSPPGHNNLTGEDCPQRGKGCIALVVDYLKNNDWILGGIVSAVPSTLPAMCTTNVVEPKFKDVPGPYKIELGGEYEATVYSNAEEVKAVKQYNTDERKRMEVEIEKHRSDIIAKEPELAIEFISGHGSHDKCGAISGRGELGRSLDRATFHQGNYKAAKHHVCGWVVADFSCGSGRTPEAVDQLNNLGAIPQTAIPTGNYDAEHGEINQFITTGCRAKPKDECSQHAAYDYDLAIGTVASNKSACGLMVPAHETQLLEALGLPVAPSNGIASVYQPPPPPPAPLSIPVPRALKMGELALDSWTGFGSHYSDAGYKHCDPVERSGIWNE